MARVKTLITLAGQHWKSGVGILLLLFLAYLFLRGCIPGLGGLLPADVTDEIQKRYIVCMDDFALEPGAVKQPECGHAEIDVIGSGVIPPDAQSAGVTRAVCYKVTYANPQMTTQGNNKTTGHTIIFHSRVSSNVAIQQNGDWQIFPDQGAIDEQRWTTYACPAPYESRSIPAQD